MPETRRPPFNPIQNAILQTNPLIVGHRGASALAPENTLAALRRALDDGAHGLELDVRLAKDGVPVVIHDATLRRTGSMSGKVAGLTSKELAAVDVGSWFNRTHPDLARREYEDQRIPTLTEVFQLVSERPGIIYLELKTEDARSALDLNQSVGDLIRHFRFEKRVVVVSFDLAAIARMKSRNPSIRTGALFSPRGGHGLTWRADTILKATADCGANEILLHRLLARPRLVEKVQDGSLPVVVWTVDEPTWLVRANKLGIRALITNNPAKLLDKV